MTKKKYGCITSNKKKKSYQVQLTNNINESNLLSLETKFKNAYFYYFVKLCFRLEFHFYDITCIVIKHNFWRKTTIQKSATGQEEEKINIIEKSTNPSIYSEFSNETS